MTMTEVDRELFGACLERIRQIDRENPTLVSNYRSTAMTDPHGSVSVIRKLGHDDGTASVFFITASRDLCKRVAVTVEVWHDSHDSYWQEQIGNRERAIVVGTTHYRVGAERTGRKDHSGYGGRRFRLRNLTTGEVIETTNLWYQGTIPPKFREALPPTHEIIKERI